MEASYPVDRVTRFAGTNKRSVYMEPSYSALVRSKHCSYMKYLRRVTRLTELLALPGNSPSIENYRFTGEMFTWRKRVTPLGEFSVERGGISPRRDEYFTMQTLCPENSASREELCQQRMRICR